MSDYEPRVSKRIDVLEAQVDRLSSIRNDISQHIGAASLEKEGGGTKHDDGKPDLAILPKAFLDQTAEVMMFGAAKYGRSNYKKGLEVTRTLSAALRHIYAYLDKEDNDQESGLSHLGHAAASLAMTMENIKLGTAKDNR